MAWKVSCVMEERLKFVADCLSQEFSMAEVCRRYGVSRKTGYKWLERYHEGGLDGLKERSRAPKLHPNAVDLKTEAAVVAFKHTHMLWGPAKIGVKLRERHPGRSWPASSTIGDILDRHGLVIKRKKRNRATPSTQPLAHCANPNDVWCVDFKGWFRTGDGTRCDPLTISDGATRFLLRCVGMSGGTGFTQVKPLFEAAFREFGLPKAIRSDNGPPFASLGLAGLSKLSVWWIRLGIRPERIRPGKPQDNGRHERMHRTLKAATAHPPTGSLRGQQRAFNAFMAEYNHERPHEALGQRPPGAFYKASDSVFPSKLMPIPDYDSEYAVRKVKKSGQVKWRGRDLRITDALTGEYVGFAPIGDGLWKLYFIDIPLGTFDERKRKVKPLPKPKKKNRAQKK
jgi:putative transposase